MVRILFRHVLPTVVGAAIVVLAGLWLYGFVGVKAGWIGPTEIPGLNAVTRSGADAGGGVATATKAKLGL